MKTGRIDWRPAAIAAVCVLQVFFFAPLRVFLHNLSDFPVVVSDVLAGLLLVSGALLALVFVAVRLRPRLFLPAVVFLSVVTFLESTVFLSLARHRPLDGRMIDWSQWRALSAVELAVAAAVGLLVVAWRRRQEAWAAVALSILLFHLLAVGHTAFSRRGALREHTNTQVESYFNRFHRLSKQRNVVQVVADTTQGAMVHDIILSDAERYSAAFDGFTLYTQAMGRYLNTYPSISFLMTGRAPDPGRDFSVSHAFTAGYIRSTLKNHSIVGTLARNGFETYGYQCCSLYCAGPYSACTAGDVFDGLPLERERGKGAVLRLLDIALFQSTPIVVRKHVYDDGNWFLRRLQTRERTYSGIMDTFLASMTADATADTYNYLHLAGGHGPIQFDELCNYTGVQESTYDNQRRQVTCALLQIERLIATLRRLGIYDQTMIVVNGDHGTPGLPATLASGTGATLSSYLVGTASALVLIKPLNARGHLKISDAPGTIGDIPATVNDALHLNGRFPGQSLLHLDGSDRERHYLIYDDAERVSRLQVLPNLRRYRVRGNLFDERNWTRPVVSAPDRPPSALWMDDGNFARHATGFGRLEVQSKPSRWITGTRASVLLSFPDSGKTRLVLDSYVPPSIPGQSVAVSVNDQVIARLGEKELAASSRHVIPVPASVPRREVNTVALEMAKAVRFGDDPRGLSMVVAYIGLEPAR